MFCCEHVRHKEVENFSNFFPVFDFLFNSPSVDETKILGWDYLPYEEHLNEEREKIFDAFLTRLGRSIREKLLERQKDEKTGSEPEG